MLWFILGAFLAILAYYALVRPLNYWKQRGIAQYPIYITLREMVLCVMQQRSIADQVQMIYRDFPGRRYSGIYQFYRPIFVMRDPDLLKQVLVKDFDHFVDHMQLIPEDTDPMWEKNLVSLKGDKWRNMRATLSPSFTSSKMKAVFGVISETAKQFVQYFQDQKLGTVTLEMKDAFTRFTNDVIASSAFGVSCDSMRDPNNTFYLMGKEVTNFSGFWKSIRFIIMLISPKLAKTFGITLFGKRVSAYFIDLVKDNVQTREREGIVRQDMIHLLMEARKERSRNGKFVEDTPDEGFAVVDDPTMLNKDKRKKEQITDMDIVAQALLFFFAGFNTVSTSMCFMAHELAVNLDIQERLQSEIDDVLNDCGGTITYEALSKMKYLDMVVSETLRKWPAAMATDRICTKPYTIPPLTDDERPVDLKKGDVVWTPIFGYHRDPELYPDPERFDPERFSDENKGNIAPYTYLPFGVGPRSCIGNRFALMETKVVLFYLLSMFDIVVVDKTAVPLKLSKSPYFLTSENGFWLGLKARKMVSGVY